MAFKSKVVRETIGTWWKIERYKVNIEPLKAVAFTPAFVTYLDKRWSFSDSAELIEIRERRNDIFPSFAEAKAEAVRRVTEKIEYAKAELQRLHSELRQWESMKEPKE